MANLFEEIDRDRLKDISNESFEIQRLIPIEEGGQGAVFKAELEKGTIAFKLYNPSAEVIRVEREVEKLEQIDSKNIVSLVDHGSLEVDSENYKYVAYSYIDGQSLDDISEPQTDENVIKLLLDIIDAIEALWEKRAVHRDIKPPNVILTEDDDFILIDLGIAKHLNETTITMYGKTCGTPGYMSPEQAEGRRGLTFRSDLFSLGILAYEFASNHHPFMHKQMLVSEVDPKPLHHISPVSDGLSQFIHGLLKTSSVKRPNSLQELRIEIKEV